ncbi:MAG: hypothetical protein IPM57_01685 [Oligoflexia bacterium]|nr:hypothetical protein [Oligoflexia bacterium]
MITINFSYSTWAEDRKECLLSPSNLSEMLKLSYKSFDQTLPDGGWRGLANKGCELEATKVLEIYHLHHYDELAPWQAQILYWHAGQMYAMQGLTDLALARFKKSYSTEEKADDKFKWNAYVKGSIAFLEHDMNSLTKARDELKSANTDAQSNFKILESFIRCFKKSYKEAYNHDCKP